MTAQILYGLSREAYDALPGDNWSKVRRIAKSPAHYKHGIENEQEDTDALKFGRAAHLSVLEHDAFGREIAVWRGKVRNGKEWDAFKAEHSGKEIITSKEWTEIVAITSAVDRCEFAHPYLDDAKVEVSITWDVEIVPDYPVRCKARLDAVNDRALVDVKFARCASPEAFGKQAWDLGYTSQAAFYSDGYFAATGERKPFAFVVAEKEAPYCVAVYEMTAEQLALGRAEYERCLSILSLCRLKNEWPGYTTGPQPLVLPRWVQTQAEETLNAEPLEGAV